jgi:hypothetical protein
LIITPVEFQNPEYPVAPDEWQQATGSFMAEDKIPGPEGITHLFVAVGAFKSGLVFHTGKVARITREEPQRAVFWVRQMNGNNPALNHAPDFCRRGSKKLDELYIRTDLGG